MDLIAHLRASAPTSARECKALADSSAATPREFAELLSLAKSHDRRRQVAATQIGKRWMETGFRPEGRLLSDWLALLRGELPWECLLQVLQTLPKLSIPARDKERVWTALRNGIEAENKFVRAWSYGGLAHVANQFREHETEAGQLLSLGLKDETPAVKARIRNALKDAERLPDAAP